MRISVWIRRLRQSVARKRGDRLGGSRTVIFSEVRSGFQAATRLYTLSPAPAAARAGDQAGMSMPDRDDTLANGCHRPIRRLADIPTEIHDQIERERLLRLIHRLETPLRGLYAVTSRKDAAYSPDEMFRLFLIWRQALGDYLNLAPDERAVLNDEPEVDEAYFVRGARESGARLVVLEPCWTLDGQVALRGEAQMIGS